MTLVKMYEGPDANGTQVRVAMFQGKWGFYVNKRSFSDREHAERYFTKCCNL